MPSWQFDVKVIKSKYRFYLPIPMLKITDIIILNGISKGEFKKEKLKRRKTNAKTIPMFNGWWRRRSLQAKNRNNEREKEPGMWSQRATEEDVQYALTLGIKLAALLWKALFSFIYSSTPSLPHHINIKPFLNTLFKFGFPNPDLFLYFILLSLIYFIFIKPHQGFPGGSAVKNLHVMQEMQVWSVSQEDPLEKKMAGHSRILAWEVPWTEEPGGLQKSRIQFCDSTMTTVY